MHFNYIPIKHDIDKLQGYLDFLFFEVWLKAEGDFNFDELKPNKELHDICIKLELQDTEWGNFFNARIALIYDEFSKLDDIYKMQIKQSYISNNNIEALCCDKDIIPITYNDIKVTHPTLEKALKDFYSKLYGTNSPFNLEIFGFLSKKLLSDYDRNFMEVNDKEICPFCGINHLKGNNHSYKEAYDHFIPKGVYPFNTINFKNLAPMCHECNSTYKLTKKPIYNNDSNNIDPLQRERLRSYAFYPYSATKPEIRFKIEINSNNIDKLKKEEITLEITSDGNEEQVESWKRIFGLNERYKALLCGPSAGRAWINSIIDGFDNAVAQGSTLTRKQYYEAQLIDSKHNLVSEIGFLKSVFLETCDREGLFDNLD